MLSIPLFLGYRHLSAYYEEPFSKENFGIISLFALVLYLLYLSLFMYLGVDGLYELQKFGRPSRKLANFFIYPGIGFGLAIFPKVASEYMFNAFSMNMLRIQSQLCAITGWLLIIYLGSILIL